MNPFRSLARFVVKHPINVIAVWVIAAMAIVAVSPSLTSVTNTDQNSFLPKSSEFSKAMKLAEHSFPGSTDASTTFVFTRTDGNPLTDADSKAVSATVARIQADHIARVTSVGTDSSLVSPNHKVQLAQVVFSGHFGDKTLNTSIKPLRDSVSEALQGTHLRAGLTGGVADAADGQKAEERIDSIIMIATIVLILGLLGIIFRSPLAALLPIVSIILVYTLAQSVIAALATTFGFQVDTIVGSLLIVVLFGIGTDYILFLLFRFREQLRAGDTSKDALATAVERVGKVIASSAMAVIVAFSTLLVADLGILRALGPALAIAFALMLLAALTLIPAIISLLGTRVFWPSRTWQTQPQGSFSHRIGETVGRHPGRTLLASSGLLAALAVGVLSYKADYTDHPDGSTASAKAAKVLETGFPNSAISPTQVYLHSRTRLTRAQLTAARTTLQHTSGVAQVLPAKLAPGGTAAEIDLYLTHNSASNAAMTSVEGPVRTAAHHAVPNVTAYVGGETSALVDLRTTIDRDLRVIFPVAGILIALILLVVLRSVVAPLVLLASVALGYAATMGASVFVFQDAGHLSGITFVLPIIIYLFVLALGTDYNILMTARIREEHDAGNAPRQASALAIHHGAPTVAAAGLILAGTFASLALSGTVDGLQEGFALAVGILLTSYVMASVMVPSIAAKLGDRMWWPSKKESVQRTPELLYIEPEEVRLSA